MESRMEEWMEGGKNGGMEGRRDGGVAEVMEG